MPHDMIDTDSHKYDNRGDMMNKLPGYLACSRILPRDQLWHQQCDSVLWFFTLPSPPSDTTTSFGVNQNCVFSAIHKNYTKLFKYAALLFVPNRRFCRDTCLFKHSFSTSLRMRVNSIAYTKLLPLTLFTQGILEPPTVLVSLSNLYFIRLHWD